MTLAASLLEGYGYIGNVNTSDISDPISYLQEACIEAVNALYEASQQYYIGDIIGQVQIIQESSDNVEIVQESAGEKVRELWESFKRKVKEIVDSVVTKMQKVIQWITNKFKKDEKKSIEECKQAAKTAERISATSGSSVPKSCVDNCEAVVNIMNAAFPKMDDYISSTQDILANNLPELINSIMTDIVNNQNLEPNIERVTFKDHKGSELTAEQLNNLIVSLTESLEDGEATFVTFDQHDEILNQFKELGNASDRTTDGVSKFLSNVRKAMIVLLKQGDLIVKRVQVTNKIAGKTVPPEQFINLVIQYLTKILQNITETLNGFLSILASSSKFFKNVCDVFQKSFN